jgi:hypothetical protein
MSEANMGGTTNGSGPLGMYRNGGVGAYYSTLWGPKPNDDNYRVSMKESMLEIPTETLSFVERPDSRNFAGNDHFSVTQRTGEQKFAFKKSFQSYHLGRFVYAYCDEHVVSLLPEKTWGKSGSDSIWAGQWTIDPDD